MSHLASSRTPLRLTTTATKANKALLPVLVFAALAFPFAHCTVAFSTSPIPLNWSTVSPCAVDVPSRVLAHVVTTQYTDNTPASCIERCDAANYTYAGGVEYSNECHCGTGLAGSPVSAPSMDYDLACTGDPTLSCGGSWHIQVYKLPVYKSPALTPGAWTLQGCFVDTPTTPAFASPVHTTFATNLDLVDQCVRYCTHVGMPFAGVENASDCQCSFGYASGVVGAPESECNSTCPLPPGAGNAYCGGVQIAGCRNLIRIHIMEF